MRFYLPLLAAGLVLAVSGCALRATTDFGPGEEPHHQSVGAGAGPFPNLLGSDGHRGDIGEQGNPASNGSDPGGTR